MGIKGVGVGAQGLGVVVGSRGGGGWIKGVGCMGAKGWGGGGQGLERSRGGGGQGLGW